MEPNLIARPTQRELRASSARSVHCFQQFLARLDARFRLGARLCLSARLHFSRPRLEVVLAHYSLRSIHQPLWCHLRPSLQPIHLRLRLRKNHQGQLYMLCQWRTLARKQSIVNQLGPCCTDEPLPSHVGSPNLFDCTLQVPTSPISSCFDGQGLATHGRDINNESHGRKACGEVSISELLETCDKHEGFE